MLSTLLEKHVCRTVRGQCLYEYEDGSRCVIGALLDDESIEYIREHPHLNGLPIRKIRENPEHALHIRYVKGAEDVKKNEYHIQKLYDRIQLGNVPRNPISLEEIVACLDV